MLESMTSMQFQEWMAFFKIRDSREKVASAATQESWSYGENKDEQQRLAQDIMRKMTGYQQRRAGR